MNENEVNQLLAIKSKPETKQEMAEWLFGNVLTMESNVIIRDWSDSGKSIKNFIYSPDGFFAVWDALIEKQIAHYFSWRIERNNDSDRCTLDTVGLSNSHHAYGNRYEAFYNAVYEAMNENN